LIKAVDDERVALGKKLGVEVIPDPDLGYEQGYMAEPTYDIGYSQAPGFKGIKAQNRLDYRYFNEDVGYGLVFMKKLAEWIGLETPCMDSVIRLVSVLMDRDYLGEAKRTMESLGLLGISPKDLESLLE
jgi:opine dehydrogenase